MVVPVKLCALKGQGAKMDCGGWQGLEQSGIDLFGACVAPPSLVLAVGVARGWPAAVRTQKCTSAPEHAFTCSQYDVVGSTTSWEVTVPADCSSTAGPSKCARSNPRETSPVESPVSAASPAVRVFPHPAPAPTINTMAAGATPLAVAHALGWR